MHIRLSVTDPARILSRGLTLLCLLGALWRPATAAEIAEVEFPNDLVTEGTTLQLNGLGLRTAIFGIKVYAMALYLEQPSKDPKAIMTSAESKRLVMHFLRDLDADQLRDAWQESFTNNADSLAKVQSPLDQFKAAMTDVKEGDWMVLNIHQGKVEVSLNDKTLVDIDAEGFPPALLSVWLGEEPPNDHLKAGLLGEPVE